MPKPQTSTQFFRTLSTIHLALLGGQLFFLGIAVVLVEGGAQGEAAELISIFRVVAGVLLAASIAVSRIVFQALVTRARAMTSISSKMGRYRSAQVARWAVTEFPVLFSIVAFIVTHDYWLLAIVAVGSLYFALQYPAKPKAIFDLQLSPQETAMVNDPNAIIAETGNEPEVS